MSPFLRAMRIYQTEPCARTFWEDLHAHLMHGIVLSTPTGFAMARSVCSSWPQAMLKNPQCSVSEGQMGGNCWMMWIGVGEITPIFSLGPVKEFCCYERRNVIRILKYESFRRLFHPSKARSSSEATGTELSDGVASEVQSLGAAHG